MRVEPFGYSVARCAALADNVDLLRPRRRSIREKSGKCSARRCGGLHTGRIRVRLRAANRRS